MSDDAATAPGNSPLPKTGHVVICDDDDLTRSLLESMIGSFGLQTRSVSDGVACLDAIASSRSDVAAVVVDQVMPGMQGNEVIAAIEQLDDPPPVIWLSGYRERDDSSIALGSAVRLSKPVRLPELKATLERIGVLPAS